MFIPHLQNHGTKDHFFGENRPVHFLGLGALKDGLKGAYSKMKGDAAVAKEKVGVLKSILKWPFHAKTIPGYIIFAPFILTRKGYEGVKWTAKTTGQAGLKVGEKVGGVLKGPVVGTITETRDLARQTLKAGYCLTAGPVLEVGRSNLIHFPKRALVDQFRTGIGLIFGTSGAFLSNSLNAVKKTALAPFTLVNSCRKAVQNVLWDTPKALYQREFKEAGESLGRAPLNIIDGITSAPRAIAGIPYHTTMEAGIGIAGTAVNAGRAMAAPIEGVVNAYSTMGRARCLTDHIKEKVSAGGGYRERFKNLFSKGTPFRRVAAAA